MNDDDKIISFEAAQDRRDEAQIDTDQAHWEDLRERLLAIMMASDLHNTSLVSATVNALIEALAQNGLDTNDAKTAVTRCIRAMR